MNTTSCGHCVPRTEHLKLHRQWCLMCWLACVLLALVAGGGLLALEWRKELAYTRQALDRANERIGQLEMQTITPKVARRAK